MVRLRVLEILAERNLTKYWLYKRIEMSYQNMNRMLNNETTSIRYDTLDKLSTILDCPIGELFEKTSEEK
ncbi:MAG: helix-turn-helix transcriptional regulator [Firmicutes bacterium]|nr:helix-turn-helix transcriptional regulator [Bacillota bacterium]